MTKKKTLGQLQETHSEMCATAHDLGMKVPEEMTVDFTTAEEGEVICSNLDTLIRKFKEGLDTGDTAAGSENSLAVDANKSDTAPTKTTTTKKATKAKTAEAKPTGEDKVAKKAAKKAPAKKAAAKKNGSAAKKTGGTRVKFDDGAKITWATGKENPAREGTGRFDRIEVVRKSNGKTVKTFLAGKGNPVTLKNCVAGKLCTVA